MGEREEIIYYADGEITKRILKTKNTAREKALEILMKLAENTLDNRIKLEACQIILENAK